MSDLRDTLAFAATIVSFALFVTVHLAIVFGLLRKPPRWRALLALVAFPFAPYFALRERMRGRALVWVLALVGYTLALVFSW